MVAVARPYGGRNDQLWPLAQAAHAAPSYIKGKGSGGHFQADDGLAISYDQLDQRPSYQPDIASNRVRWEQTEPPVARRKGDDFRSAYDSHTDRSNRFDSVFDVYADMYAEDDDEGEEHDEDAVEELQRGMSARGLRQQEERTTYDSQQPWDERGKTGLYGGGGRGADDRETGWVSDYAFAPVPPVSGYEEDLRFDGDEADEDFGPTSRLGSRGTVGSRLRGGDELRRESSDTVPSSKGPSTPPDTDVYSSAGSASYQDGPASRVAAPLSPPIHTVDAARIKKNMSNSRIPTPSAPMPAASMDQAGATLERPTRPRTKTGGFKWAVRSKKAPTISAPILPEGFVESLGMETFALYPGVKPPQHAVLSPVVRQSQISPMPPSGFSSATSQQQRAPPTRKAAPRPKNAPGRVEPVSPIRGSPPGPQRGTAASATPLRVGALRHDCDTTSEGSPENVFCRLSKDSDASSVPRVGPAKVSSRTYFHGIRQKHGHPHQEQQANRGPFSNGTLGSLGAPPSGLPTPAPYQHERTASNATVGSGFRDPWSTASGSAGSGASMHSQQTHTGGNRTSYFHGSERASLASTAHEYDYRNGAPAGPGSALRHYLFAHEVPASPATLDRTTEDRNGSFSSVYSEGSEVPPMDDFDPSNAFRPGFAPSNAAGQLRKHSSAGALPTVSSLGGGRGAPAPGWNSAASSYAPIQPLSLGRRPSHAYRPAGDDPNRNTLAGDVVWGGAGIGGPRDVSSPTSGGAHAPSPFVASFAGRAPTIGTTGFRNPFG